MLHAFWAPVLERGFACVTLIKKKKTLANFLVVVITWLLLASGLYIW